MGWGHKVQSTVPFKVGGHNIFPLRFSEEERRTNDESISFLLENSDAFVAFEYDDFLSVKY